MTTPLTANDAARRLKQGGVIAYPTEAVWGLGCDPFNEAAAHRLLAIKQRSVDKGLILIASQFTSLRPLLGIEALPPSRLADVLATWPGPHTWTFPASPQAPSWITGQHTSLAVRVSDHPDVIALCEAFGGALVSTSANSTGYPPARLREALEPGLLAQLDGVMEGETGGLERPTPIRDAMTGEHYRD